MIRTTRTTACLSALALTLTVFLCGCENPDGGVSAPPVMVGNHEGHDHGHGAHPETLGEALHLLTELRDTVRDAFAEGDSETAHGPLHEVGHLIDEMAELAEKAGLSEEANAVITANAEILMDSFGAVDKKMHSADEGSDYSEMSAKIDAALAAIMTAAGPAGEHHDHDDHEGHDHNEDHADHGKDDHDDHDHKEGEKKE